MKTVIEMAREAGFMAITDADPDVGAWYECFTAEIERFAELARADERAALIGLLKGIDETEIESAEGWWETSAGADFGAGILAAIRARGENT